MLENTETQSKEMASPVYSPISTKNCPICDKQNVSVWRPRERRSIPLAGAKQTEWTGGVPRQKEGSPAIGAKKANPARARTRTSIGIEAE